MFISVLTFSALLFAGPALPPPDELDDSFQALKEAESKKDPALIKKLAAETCALARKTVASTAPESEDEKTAWKARVGYARDIEVHTEYALYVAATQGPPASTIDLLSTLEQQNPKSKYLADAYGLYFLALNQTGGASKITAVAGKAIAHFPENEDLLVVLADSAFNSKQYDRAITFARRLTVVLPKHGKPEGMSAAQWESKRSGTLARAYWIAGVASSERQQFAEADKALRAALPLIEGNQAMLGPALFHLGWVNYHLGRQFANKARMLEAAKFCDRAAQIPGPYAQQAWRNAKLIRDEAVRMP